MDTDRAAHQCALRIKEKIKINGGKKWKSGRLPDKRLMPDCKPRLHHYLTTRSRAAKRLFKQTRQLCYACTAHCWLDAVPCAVHSCISKANIQAETTRQRIRQLLLGFVIYTLSLQDINLLKVQSFFNSFSGGLEVERSTSDFRFAGSVPALHAHVSNSTPNCSWWLLVGARGVYRQESGDTTCIPIRLPRYDTYPDLPPKIR